MKVSRSLKINVVQFFLLSFLFPALVFSQEEIPFSEENISPEVHQVVVVKEKSQGSSQGELTAWERKDGVWQKYFGPVDVMLGRNGLAPANEKREGDGRTPSGIFKLERAFGYEPLVNTKLAYTQVTENDFWIDDVESPQYNQWVKGTPQAKSFEYLKRPDDLYKYAIVVEYNTNPVVPGMGSAIFLHIWREADQPTAGCVAMNEQNILKLLSWLDRDKNPLIILGK